MKRVHHRWYSPNLERDMDMLVFGEAGARVLVYPTRDGSFHEYEDLGIVASVADKIDGGHLQLYCVDNIAAETFYCFWKEPRHRILMHQSYEDYVLGEVLPFMDEQNSHACRIAHGCSLGAYLAADIAFRHPGRFHKLAAFSGRYDVTEPVEHFHDLLDGYFDDLVYFHNPSRFLPNLEDETTLATIRRLDIILTVGSEDPFYDNNRRLCHTLQEKAVPHQLHVWDGRAHKGSYWRKMAALYL